MALVSFIKRTSESSLPSLYLMKMQENIAAVIGIDNEEDSTPRDTGSLQRLGKVEKQTSAWSYWQGHSLVTP